ncbi:MAG: hypothetical protein PHO75_02645 [Candidatus Shapirobacteria bacterium]|nr:hypothetical protein [Candidatus Shapirobacteria bacterium]
MSRNIENELRQEGLSAIRNKEILDGSGMTTLLTGLNEITSNPKLKKKDPVISILKHHENWEFLILSYMWCNQDNDDEVTHRSLTLMSTVIDEKRIHLLFREVDQNGEKKVEKSIVNLSDQVKKEEMMEKITSKFSASLINYKRV